MIELIQPVLFYLLSTVLIGSAIAVIAARNPVHAVLFLILCFFNAAGLFLLLNAEFLAFILVIVYVGAVAVLFLFVVMMLDIDFRELRRGFIRYLPAGLAVGGILAVELVFMSLGWNSPVTPVVPSAEVESTRAIGRVLYTDYFYPFQVSGLILLVAMIGAIVLTLRARKDARRQNIDRQLARRVDEVLDVVKAEKGKGVL